MDRFQMRQFQKMQVHDYSVVIGLLCKLGLPVEISDYIYLMLAYSYCKCMKHVKSRRTMITINCERCYEITHACSVNMCSTCGGVLCSKHSLYRCSICRLNVCFHHEFHLDRKPVCLNCLNGATEDFTMDQIFNLLGPDIPSARRYE